MAELRFRLVREGDLVSGEICFETDGKYSHVEILLDDGTTLGARADGGVKIRPADYAKFSAIKVYGVSCTDQQKSDAMAFAMSQIGKPYDFVDIAAILFRRNWRCPDHWICSEYWAAWMEAGKLIHPIAGDISHISPRDADVIASAVFGNAAVVSDWTAS